MRIIVAHGADESIDGPKGRRKTDVQEVADVLRQAGHEVSGLAVDGTPECLRVLAQAQADLVFNLVGSLGKDDTGGPQGGASYIVLVLANTGSVSVASDLHIDQALRTEVCRFECLHRS